MDSGWAPVPPAPPLSLRLDGGARPAARSVVSAAAATTGLGGDIDATIAWAVTVAADIPQPGGGRTGEAWESLASAAAVDVAGARVLEPHVDALAILSQAGEAGITVDLDRIDVGSDSSWGVFAAEGARLEARPSPTGWRLTGTKNWCSLAQHLSHALVTAWTSPETRRLFAVPLRRPEVRPHGGPWVARGLTQIVSAPVDFDEAEAVPVGEDGWYLERPGFAWGGIGVAAVWWGAAAPLVSAVGERAAAAGADQLALMHAGATDAAFSSTRAVLAETADAVDAGLGGHALKIAAERARSITATHVEAMLATADRALGPGPLTTDDAHARRVSDLRIYLRQHHGERDLARLGRLLTRP